MARRTTSYKPPQPPVLTVDQKRRRIERLETCIRDLEAFDPQTVQKRYSVPKVMALEAAIDAALAAAFGHGTHSYNRYKDAATLDNGPHTMRVQPAFGRGPTINYEAQDAHEARRYLAEGKQRSLHFCSRGSGRLRPKSPMRNRVFPRNLLAKPCLNPIHSG